MILLPDHALSLKYRVLGALVFFSQPDIFAISICNDIFQRVAHNSRLNNWISTAAGLHRAQCNVLYGGQSENTRPANSVSVCDKGGSDADDLVAFKK